MGKYQTAQICINGHCITSSCERNPELTQKYCEKCGAKTITHCPNCEEPIRGYFDTNHYLDSLNFVRPLYCHNCGKPYPWTKSAISSTSKIVLQDALLSDTDKNSLVTSLPDIISETTNTNVSAMQFEKCLHSAEKFTSEALRQFAIDFGCALFLKLLGL